MLVWDATLAACQQDGRGSGAEAAKISGDLERRLGLDQGQGRSHESATCA